MNVLLNLISIWRALMATGLAAAALAGCGVGTGGTGGNATAYAAGPISGFGSVIVNGVRFDDSAASVEDGDGGRRSSDDLRLGMTVEIDSSAISTTAAGSSARADRIRFESELNGVVGSIDLFDGSFTLLGQRVSVDAATVFDNRLDGGGLSALRVGQLLEVYAVFDPLGGRYRATRLEQGSLAAGLRLRGPLAQVDTTARTLRIGASSYSYDGAGAIPANLAAGQFVRLRLGLLPQPVLRWVVQSFGTPFQALPEADEAKIEGLISSLGPNGLFAVNGRPVDASAAAVPSGLAIGMRVEVEGTLRLGVLRATKVKILSDDDVSGRGFELNGSIAAVNSGQATLVLRGLTVSTARSGLSYENGTVADLLVGRSVELRAILAADRRTLEATRIRFR